MGYVSGTDFTVSSALAFSSYLGITSGQYDNDSTFTRGDVAIISYNSLLLQPKIIHSQTTQAANKIPEKELNELVNSYTLVIQCMSEISEAIATIKNEKSFQNRNSQISAACILVDITIKQLKELYERCGNYDDTKSLKIHTENLISVFQELAIGGSQIFAENSFDENLAFLDRFSEILYNNKNKWGLFVEEASPFVERAKQELNDEITVNTNASEMVQTELTADDIQGTWRGKIMGGNRNEEFTFSGNNFTIANYEINDGKIDFLYGTGTYSVIENGQRIEVTYSYYSQDDYVSFHRADPFTKSLYVDGFFGNKIIINSDEFTHVSDDEVTTFVKKELDRCLLQANAGGQKASRDQIVQMRTEISNAANNTADGLTKIITAGGYNVRSISSRSSLRSRYKEREKSYLQLAQIDFSVAKGNIQSIRNIAVKLNNSQIVSNCDRIEELYNQMIALTSADTSSLALCRDAGNEITSLLTEISNALK